MVLILVRTDVSSLLAGRETAGKPPSRSNLSMKPLRRALTALVAAGLLAATLSACANADASDIASATGDADPADVTPAPTSTLTPQEQALKFVQCMRDHGVPMDDPEFAGGGGIGINIGGEGTEPSAVEAAMEACREFAPFGGDGNSPPDDPEMAENLRKFAQCMRDNGVPDFPDPDGGRLMLDGTITADPDFETAQAKCQAEFLPGMTGPSTQGNGPGGGPGSGTVVGGPGGGTTT